MLEATKEPNEKATRKRRKAYVLSMSLLICGVFKAELKQSSLNNKHHKKKINRKKSPTPINPLIILPVLDELRAGGADDAAGVEP